MTVVDTSVVVDFLLGGAAAAAVERALALRQQAWQLRENCTIADGLFAALAAQLDEPLLTADRRLAIAAREHAGVTVLAPA